MEIMNKVAVVTGASKGIGAATAIAFGKDGYNVVINYQNDKKAAQEVVNMVESFGQKAIAIQANIFLEDGINDFFDKIEKEFPSIDVLVNNAGTSGEPVFGEITCQDLNKFLGANFGATVLCSQRAVKLMKKGSILFTSSIYGLNFGGNPGSPIYSASKAAMINFAQTLSEKLAPDIRCNVVAPGTTKTPAWDKITSDYAQKSLDMTLLKSWVNAEEIAEAFLFLANTPHVTGQTIVIDSGWQKKIRENSPKRNK